MISSNAKVGDTFAIHTTDTVAVDGWIASPCGRARRSDDIGKWFARTPRRWIQMDWSATDGVHLTSQKSPPKAERQRPSTMTTSGALGPSGLRLNSHVATSIDGTKTLDAHRNPFTSLLRKRPMGASHANAQATLRVGFVLPGAQCMTDLNEVKKRSGYGRWHADKTREAGHRRRRMPNESTDLTGVR